MGAMASQISSLTIVYSTVHSGADQRKHQSSASLAFVREIHRWPVNFPHKGPVTRKMFSFNDVIMIFPFKDNTRETVLFIFIRGIPMLHTGVVILMAPTHHQHQHPNHHPTTTTTNNNNSNNNDNKQLQQQPPPPPPPTNGRPCNNDTTLCMKRWGWFCYLGGDCPASRTTLVATRFRVAVICPIIQVPHCIRVFFYFVWFVFINHIFQFYYELCTYCNILDIYLS